MNNNLLDINFNEITYLDLNLLDNINVKVNKCDQSLKNRIRQNIVNNAVKKSRKRKKEKMIKMESYITKFHNLLQNKDLIKNSNELVNILIENMNNFNNTK